MVPRFTDFYIPVLQVMSDIEPIEINTLIDKVADHMKLSELDKSVITEGGTQLKYRSNISWAVTDLYQGNFIERVKRGNYVITIKGLELLEEKPVNIGRDYLAKCSEEFRIFLERRGTRKKKDSTLERQNSEGNGKNSTYPSEESTYGNFNKDINNSKNNNQPELVASLDDLYKAVETLRKANISTVEIENKILELENEKIINKILPDLSKLLSNSLGWVNKEITFTVEYQPNKELRLCIGNVHKSLSLSHTKAVKGSERNNEKKDSFKTQNGSTRKEKEKSIPDQKINQRPNQQANLKYASDKKKNIRVWIETYKDRMILIRGDVEQFEELFISYGGRKIKDSTEGWTGWIFMNNREDGLRKDLSSFLIEPPSATNISSTLSSYPVNEDNLNESLNSNIMNKYVEVFNSMKRFNFLGITGPHKAVLLISIFKGIRSGIFHENKIKFTSELESLYNENWNLYVGGFPSLGAVYPFVHLGREPFFQHKLLRPINNYDKTWSRHTLERHIDYALIDRKIVDLVKDESIFELFVDNLTRKYCQEESIREIGKTVTALEFQTHNVPFEELKNMNVREEFSAYLANSDSKHGKSYSKKSIVVYVRALNSPSMNELVSELSTTNDVFNIQDLTILNKIKQIVDYKGKENNSFLLAKSALKLYINYVTGMYGS